MKKPSFLFLGAAALLASCSSTGTAVHGGSGIFAHGTIYDSVDSDRTISRLGYAGSPEVDVSAIGVRYEAWQSPSTSILIGVDQRDYDYNVKNGDKGESLEIHAGGRYYFLENDEFQPFLQATFFRGSGIDWNLGRGESDSYWGLGVGGGIAWFVAHNAMIEAGVRYEQTLVDPETTRRSGGTKTTVKDEIAGVTGWFGLGWMF